MNPYYQPPRYDQDEKMVPSKAEPDSSPARPRPRRGWYVYVGGFFLITAGICLVVSNSLGWHPAPLPPPSPPAATSAAK